MYLGTTQSSQTVDGSSFESASSMHSLSRVDAICEDLPTTIEEKSKCSPSHTDSSSSDSYGVPATRTSPSRPTMSKTLPRPHKKEKLPQKSVSDDERSEKPSSHDEKDYKTMRVRRSRDWSEDERRRKKGNFKLEFDSGSKPAAVATPLVRPLVSGIKKISPDDKVALNILDGASPSKQKRFRPKTRRLPRNRSVSGEETLVRRPKTATIKSPETCNQAICSQIPKAAKSLSPSKFQKPHSPKVSPKKHPKTCSPIRRLKAISAESLRSVSPGSDSVFYSEADHLDHNVS